MRASLSLIILIGLLLGIFILPQMALFAENSVNPSLNKAAVNDETPFIVLGMGCFWGAEKRMQNLIGVLDVQAGYAGGDVASPDYETLHNTEAEINSGKAIKNHAEVVKVYFDPKQTTLEKVLIQFWENHNPAQGNRQGNDIGSNYRSAIYFRSEEERLVAQKTRAIYQKNLAAALYTETITTEIEPLKNYTPAEDYHQDYLEKNPLGYCGLGGTGVAYSDPNAPGVSSTGTAIKKNHSVIEDWDKARLSDEYQLLAFEAVDCGYCRKFDKEILARWQHSIPIFATNSTSPPPGWKLQESLFATPTIVLFVNKQETARYTGYQGVESFWAWLDSEKAKIPAITSQGNI